MKIERVCAVYWSATGTTKKVALAAAKAAAARLKVPMEGFDWTLPGDAEKEISFTDLDLVFFAVPTYAGKVPNKILPHLQSGFHGNGALAAAVVLFGNRSFDNSLAELCAVLETGGFHTVAGAAFVGQHAFSNTLAAGRPNNEDVKKAESYGVAVAEKVISLTEVPAPVQVPGDAAAPYYIPKGTDGQPAKFLKAKPLTDGDKCTHCGVCAAVCPMGAIDAEDVSSVPGTCIKCQACVRGCAAHAKYFDDPAFLSHVAMLEQNFQAEKQPQLFV